MPSYIPVPSLSFLSLEVTADLVITSLSVLNLHTSFNVGKFNDLIEKRLLGVADYLSNVTPTVANELLHYVLRLDDLEPALKIHILELLLRPTTRTLTFGIVPQEYYSRLVSVVCQQGTGLQSLDLRGVWLKGKFASQLPKLLEGVPKLINLRIPHMATDSALHALRRTSLRMLDISGECFITEQGIRELCPLASSLCIVDIGNPGGEDVTPQIITMLIKCLPNVTSLGTYAQVGKALMNISDDAKTNLQYVHDTHTDLAVIQAIIRKCPFLESVYLDQPLPGVIPCLSSVTKLNQLKLHKFECSELLTLLSKCGSQFLSVELILGTGVLNLSQISSHCQYLLKLVCYKIEFIRHFEHIPFKSLKKLGVFYSDLSTSCTKFILTSSPQLEELSLGDSFELTDVDIHELFSNKTLFQNLRDVWLPNAKLLTVQSVQTFIQECPNLHSLGEFSGWDITLNEVNEFRAAIQAENIDLKLWEYFG